VKPLRALPLALLAAATTIALVGVGDPTKLTPELAWAPPGPGRVLGSGEGGVDLLAVLAHAEAKSLALATIVSALGFAVGVPVGAAAALARGTFERVVSRACDLLQAFPSFLLAMAVLSAVRSPSRLHLGCVFLITAWVPFARLALAEARVLRSAAFVEAARALGLSPAAVLARHVVPNVVGVAAVQLGASGAALVVGEAALSFVGLGARDGVSLGALLDQGVVSMLRAPHVLVLASSAVFLSSAAMMAAGRALEPKR